MGLENLIEYLRQIVPEERVYLFKKAYERLIVQFGEPFHSDINTLLAYISDQDFDTQLTIINQQTLDWLSEALKKYGVFINDEVVEYNHLDIISELLGGLIECDDYEDPKSLFDTLAKSNFSDEGFFDTIAIFTNYNATEYMEVVGKLSDSVVPHLVDVLKNIIEANDTEDNFEQYQPLPQALINMMRDPNIRGKVHEDLAEIIIRQTVHLSIKSLVRVYGARIADLIDRTSRAYSWVALILYSFENNPEELFKIWEPFYIEQQTLLDSYHDVTNLYAKLTNGQ